jgi:hypothetical protein
VHVYYACQESKLALRTRSESLRGIDKECSTYMTFLEQHHRSGPVGSLTAMVRAITTAAA